MLWFASLLLVWLTGCGYTLNHRLKTGFEDKRGIYVPVFDNDSDEMGVEIPFTNALIRELSSRGNIVFSSQKEGGLELHGTINTVNISATAYTPPNVDGLAHLTRLPTELGVTVAMWISLYDPEAKTTLWQRYFRGFRRVNTSIDPKLDRTFNYQAPSSLGLMNQSIAESQYAVIARDMMRDVYDEMAELF